MVEPREGEPHVQFTWAELDEVVEEIATRVEASGRTFTHIHGLCVGGWTLVSCLAHRLGLEVADVRFFPKLQILGHKLKQVEPGLWTQDVCRPENLLVVDDLSDTGKQLQPYRDAKLYIATIHKKPWTKVVPDIWIRETTLYVDYPWEKKNPNEKAPA